MNSNMISIVLVALIVFFSENVSSRDSTTLLLKGTMLTHDSTIVFISIDTTTTRFIQETIRPELDFWKRNEGTLLVSLLAVLTASLSVFVTHLFSKRRERRKILLDRRKAEDVYSGLLFASHSVLLNHQHIIPLLKSELQGILDATERDKELPLEKPYTSIPLDLIDQILLRLMAYESLNTKVLTLMTTYSLFAANVNTNLNLAPVMNLKSKYKKDHDYFEAVKLYFVALTKMVGKMEGTLMTLKKSILEELKRFPQNNLIDEAEGDVQTAHITPNNDAGK